MSDYQIISKNLKVEINNLQVPNVISIQPLPKEILDSTVGEEKELFSLQTSEFEFNKKNLKYIFSNPKYVSSIKVHLANGIPVKTLKLHFIGSSSNIYFELKNEMLRENSLEIKVDCFIRGFELFGNKQIKKTIKGIEAFGCDTETFYENLQLVKKLNPVITNLKSEIFNQLSSLDTSFNLLQIKEKKLAEIDTQIATNTLSKDSLKKEVDSLEKTIIQNKSEINAQHETLFQMKKQEEDSATAAKESKQELATTRVEIKEEQKRLNGLLEKKSFYNETLVGHKRETLKNIIINVLLMAGMIYVLKKLITYVMEFYQETISQIATIGSNEKLIAIIILRVGAGILFFFVFKYCFRVLSQMFSKTYQLVTDIRNIEGKLIMARAVTETALKAGNFSPEEHRNFSAAVSFFVMKNHFLNMSHESIVDDLEVNEAEVEKALPRFQMKFPLKYFKRTEQIPVPSSKGPEINN